MFELVDAEKARFPIQVLCEVLDVSRSGFYAWKKRPPSAREKSDERLAVEIAATHAKSKKRYGSPRVHRALRKKGIRVGKKRVARLMRSTGLIARQKRRFRGTTDSAHASPIAPNLVARNFEAEGPNQVWVGDVTYVATSEGWTYLAVLLDLFSRRIVGWAMSETNDTELALHALEDAVSGRPSLRAGLIHHTDRGSPYASDDYRAALSSHGMIASMSRKGDCWDNAVAESFWSTLKAELTELTFFPTRAAAREAVFEYLERFYNHDRLHSRLGYTSPSTFERLAIKRPLAA